MELESPYLIYFPEEKMPKVTKFIFLPALIILLLCSSLFADFTAKTKMTLTSMMGNMETQTTYLIKGEKIATVTTTSSPMMAQAGQESEQKMKMILLDGGKQMMTIDYGDSTYSVMDEKMIDSVAVMMQDMGGMLDSLKEMMDVKTMSAKMTGQTKEIQGLKAEEMSLTIDMVMKGQMMGPDVTEIPMKITGSQWGTKDFPGSEEYGKTVQKVGEIMMSGSSGGMGGIMPLMEAFGIEKGTLEEAMKFATYIPIEGTMTISMEIPGMPLNMQMTTSLVSASKDAIPDAEFEAPKGFKKTEPDFDFSGGGFSFPGMGQ
jgi:hypothetical protein